MSIYTQIKSMMAGLISSEAPLTYIIPTEEELAQFMRDSAEYYANELLRFEEIFDPERAREQANKEVYSCFKEGVFTPHHYFFKIMRNNEFVGYIWYEQEIAKVYLMYMFVFNQYRRQGIAEKALEFYEQKSKELGASECILYVFQQNTPAVELYRKAGYEVSREVMLNDAVKNSRFIMTKAI